MKNDFYIERKMYFLLFMKVVFIFIASNTFAQSPLCSSTPNNYCCEYVSEISIAGNFRTAASTFSKGVGNLGYYD